MFTQALSSIGLDIGVRWIKGAQLRRGRSGYELSASIRMRRSGDTPELTAEEADRLEGVLRRQGLTGNEVVLAVPNQRLVRQVMELPPRASGAPLDQLAKAELARVGKCAPEEMEAVWWELPSGARASEGTHVMGVACPHQAAEEIMNSVENAGLRVVALDTPSTAIARACAKACAGAQVVTIVDLGWRGVTIAVFAGGVLAYERIVEAEGLGQAFEQLQRTLDLDADVAEYLIERVGVDANLKNEDLPFTADQAALLDEGRQIIQSSLRAAVEEIRASVAYAARRFSGASTPRVLLCGGGMQVPGVRALISEAVGESAQAVTPAQCITVAESFCEGTRENLSLLSAIGLAMHDGRKVQGGME